VTATDPALAAIERLRAAHGPLAFFQSGGCCDGGLPICLKLGELPPGFYIDAEQYRRWGSPSLVLDLSEGAAEGFSLSPPQAHFVTRPPTFAARS
jgi:uncharacterized protein (DUF779 family)